jgi:hypothetical protein
MLRDTLKAALAIACMTIGAELLVETRFEIAAIDIAHRQALAPQIVAQQMPQQMEPPGRLRQFGRSAINLADAALSILR